MGQQGVKKREQRVDAVARRTAVAIGEDEIFSHCRFEHQRENAEIDLRPLPLDPPHDVDTRRIAQTRKQSVEVIGRRAELRALRRIAVFPG